MIHVTPIDDWIDHTDTVDCPCEPRVEYLDPDTGLPYPEDGPLVIHNALDGRK